MSAGVRCATCIWWQLGGAALAAVKRNPAPHPDMGTCNVRPPVPVALGGSWHESIYPETRHDALCALWEEDADDSDDGEHQPSNILPIA